MSIDAMKQALEALEGWANHGQWVWPETALEQCKRNTVEAIPALRLAIEQADEQEAWKTSDMAYRPEGLPQDFVRHEVDTPDDWSEWVCPDPTQYFMKCCDCGLVHEMQFNIVKYSEGDKCEDFDDPYVQAVFRARRVEQAERQESYWQEEARRYAGNADFWREKAKRQPLTEEQLKPIADEYRILFGGWVVDFARTIERAHGIGGGE